MNNYIIHYVDMNKVDQTFEIKAKDIELAEEELRKKHGGNIYYMLKIEQVLGKKIDKVFPL